jgi:hypothetical protein
MLEMNLKKIKSEDKKRILSLYLTTIGNCENCGECFNRSEISEEDAVLIIIDPSANNDD